MPRFSWSWDEYFKQQQAGDKKEKENGGIRLIELRFTERIANPRQAIDVGIYKTTVSNNAAFQHARVRQAQSAGASGGCCDGDGDAALSRGNRSCARGSDLIADLLHDFLDGALPAVQHGADLHGGGFDGGAHRTFLSG